MLIYTSIIYIVYIYVCMLFLECRYTMLIYTSIIYIIYIYICVYVVFGV